MAKQLKIYKLNSIPTVLEPSALYFIKTASNKVNTYITDNQGIVIYTSMDTTDVTQVVMVILESLKDQPGGVPTLDDNANIVIYSDNAEPALLDTIKLVRNKLAGNNLLAAINDSGNLQTFESLLGTNKVGMWNPPGNATTVPGVFGLQAFITLGTATSRTTNFSSLFNSTRRLGYVSGNPKRSLCGYRIAAAQYAISNGNGVGGFFLIHRFGISDYYLITGARMFVGMRSSTGAGTNVSPATINNCIGVGHESGDNNLSLYYGGSVPQTPIDLGPNFPITANEDIYELALYSPVKEANTLYWQVTRLNTKQSIGGKIVNDTGNKLPSNTTPLTSINAFRSNNNDGGVVAIDVISHYIRTEI